MEKITFMDCWNFIAPLLPVNDDCAQEIYVKTFRALKEAEERGKQKSDGSAEDEP